MRYALIIGFAICPWLMALAINKAAPYYRNDQIAMLEAVNIEPLVKHQLFLKRPAVDTVVCGDSRSGTIAPGPFARRGWTFFNWSLSGLCPGDTVMQLNYSLLHGAVKRVVIGASFENMALPNAASCSRYSDSVPFNNDNINKLPGGAPAAASSAPAGGFKAAKKSFEASFSLSAAKTRARSRWKYLVGKYVTNRQFDQVMDEYGNYLYTKIRGEIENKTFDYAANRDPAAYFNREDSESGFLKNKRLSVEAKSLMSGMFRELRARKIKTVVFETVKLPAYQALVDADPLLSRLQAEWRDFYRSESYGGVLFLQAKDVGNCYHFDEFFDAAHFLGNNTEAALSERLAAELEQLEKTPAGK